MHKQELSRSALRDWLAAEARFLEVRPRSEQWEDAVQALEQARSRYDQVGGDETQIEGEAVTGQLGQ